MGIDVPAQALDQPVAGDARHGVGAERAAGRRPERERHDHQRGEGPEHERPQDGRHQRAIPLAIESMSSADLIALLFTSNARCALIMLTISSTTDTFDDSRKPWLIEPKPFSPGMPVSGWPEAAVGKNRFLPIALSPAGLTKRA